MKKCVSLIIADNVKSLMASRNLTANSLAKAAGLNHAGLYSIVQGKVRNPRIDTIEKIADALGVTVVDLLAEVSSNDLRETVFSRMAGLGEEDQRRISDMVDFMVRTAKPQKKE